MFSLKNNYLGRGLRVDTSLTTSSEAIRGINFKSEFNYSGNSVYAG